MINVKTKMETLTVQMRERARALPVYVHSLYPCRSLLLTDVTVCIYFSRYLYFVQSCFIKANIGICLLNAANYQAVRVEFYHLNLNLGL